MFGRRLGGRGIGAGGTQRRGGSGAYVFVNSEAAALVARFTSNPTNSRKYHIDTLVGSLKTAGVWTKLDAFYVMAAHDEQAALLSWNDETYNLTVAAGTPVFTADRGVATNGTSSKYTTGFNPLTAANPKFTQDDAFMCVWALNLSASGRFGNDRSRAGWTPVPTIYSRANDATTTNTVGIDAGTRLFTWSRSAAASYARYTNGTAFDTPAVVSTGVISQPFDLGETFGSFGAGPYSAAAFGSGLTATEVGDLYDAINTYMTAVGAA